MTDDYIHHLNKFNHSFYSYSAVSFSRTRSSQWEGWARALPAIQTVFDAVQNKDKRPQVIDIGCGNGRFLDFLHRHSGLRDFSYQGIDLSQELLNHAAAVATDDSIKRTLIQADLVETLLLSATQLGADLHTTDESAVISRHSSEPMRTTLAELFSPRPDLIAVLGVMHHIPTFDLRKQLLEATWRELAPGGLLIITFWQFADGTRFSESKTSPTLRHVHSTDSSAPQAAQADRFSDNDYLLPWQNKPAARYAHHFCSDEIAKLLQSLYQATPLDSFTADGKEQLNYYLILKKNA
jgi:SAM-dependent methyltransferase